MPYLTPLALPEGDDCRPLSIPADTDWLALFGGALTELTKTYNWQFSGGLTVDETVAKMTEIIDAWYQETCTACQLPGGGRIIRINADGHIEQLGDGGEWEAATDEYYIPPPDAREGGTPQDQMCLAAANAVNVLEQLYESLTDSFGESLNEAAAYLAMADAFAGLVGFAIAPITAGVAAFALAVAHGLYTALSYITQDYWDEDVSEQFRCFLYDCASNDDGVVTFDWDCLTNKLHSLANNFSLTENQILLYGQLSYLLWMIGGIDALNLAGATTAITEVDCECGGTWCYTINLMDEPADFVEDCAATGNPYCAADWVFGSGWQGWSSTSPAGQSRYAAIRLDFPAAAHLTRIVAGGRVLAKDDAGDDTMFIRVYRADTTFVDKQQFNAAGTEEFAVNLDTIDEEFVALLFVPTSEADGVGGAATGTPTAQFVTFYGTGDRPSGWVNNCVE